MYKTFLRYTTTIQVVSCDEALLDISSLVQRLKEAKLSTSQAVETIAAAIRKEIIDATGCPCSTGIGENILLAKLATRRAKPNGQFYMAPSLVASFLAELPVKQLPGVGRALSSKLKSSSGSLNG